MRRSLAGSSGTPCVGEVAVAPPHLSPEREQMRAHHAANNGGRKLSLNRNGREARARTCARERGGMRRCVFPMCCEALAYKFRTAK